MGPDDRLVDVLETAMGPTAEADLVTINLATRMRDEGYYYIPNVYEAPPPFANALAHLEQASEGNGLGTAGGTGSNLIDLNTALLGDLMGLPCIGEVKAQAILDYREEHGSLPSVDAITQVKGIGLDTLENVRDLAMAKRQ